MQSATEREISGNIVDVLSERIYYGTLVIQNGRIADIRGINEPARDGQPFLFPGFVDAHVHIESSMLAPTEFARLAVVHGTVATVSDPHEIANVLGAAGVWYMVENAEQSPLKFHFGAPSCVPATPFDRSGGTLNSKQVAELLDDDRIKYLSEMMNFPGVLHDDPEVLAKIAAAKERGKPVDGHAPQVRGDALAKYIAAGISTDHESRSYDEGLEKLQRGMKLLIREGSAAKDFEALHPLIVDFPQQCMFCSDDKHPDELTHGHINQLVRRGLAKGLDLFKLLQVACVNPVQHYGLDVGLLQIGDAADFLEVDNLTELNIGRVFIDGQVVCENGTSLLPRIEPTIVNQFQTELRTADEFIVKAQPGILQVIEAIGGQLITKRVRRQARIKNGQVLIDLDRDVLKIALVDRYTGSPPSVAFVRNFGLKHGAIASSVSHDSHNIIAVGTSDEEIARAINLVIEAKGGISVAAGERTDLLPLPIAGLMSNGEGHEVAAAYARLDGLAKELGSKLAAPFMTLSFMALTVIPELKLGPEGLFDVAKFSYVSLFE
ncbi:MAG: adenine deaminase [Planctomycetota bacterium]|nr:adenine deaminase [Planctomycetota bacterium]